MEVKKINNTYLLKLCKVMNLKNKFRVTKPLATIISLVIITILSVVFQGCENDEIVENDNILVTEELFQDNEYNTDFSDFAKAVSKALNTNPSFRKVVKEEALLMIDGDYDVILKRVISKKVAAPVTLKSANVNYTVKDLLEDSYSTSGQLNLKSASTSIIDELSNKYPDMQIAVPVHAEDWDEENYIPTVTFLPLEYDDATTTTITGYDSQGNIVPIDIINEPSKPVIVISENERMIDIEQDPDYPIVPSTPTNLSGTQTESGIRLTWEMPSGTKPFNTTGYYVYRKSAGTSSYTRIKTVGGAYNRSYDDNNVEAGRSYSYYVMAYYQGENSSPSNYITLTAPNYPKPVLSFDAIQNSKNEIELRWQNDHSQYILETKVSKHVIGVTSGYQFLKSFTANEQDYFDNNVTVGKKVVYKINHVTSFGESNAKYDFVQVPYRDISQKSPVYIKKIKFSDWKIERWPAGKPEFYITVTNVDAGGKTPYKVQDEINCQFSSRSSTSQVFTGKKVLDWKPGFWFDMLSFYVVEYDRSWGKLHITASVGYNTKNQDSTAFNTPGKVAYSYTIQDKGEKCGNSYLNYYDNPETWLEFPNYGVKVLVSESDN